MNAKRMMTVLAAAAAAVLTVVAAPPDAAAEYPERPVQFLVPWPPGDIDELIARLMAERFQEETGVPAAVINKPGGGGVIGATEVFQAPADGYVVGVFPISLSTTHIINGNTPYDRGDFEPVGIFVTFPMVLATLKDAPYNDMAELAAYAKENDVTLGHLGHSIPPTLLVFQAAKRLGIEFAGEAAFDITDCATLSNGDADVINSTAQLVLPCLTSGEIKLLASFTDGRSPLTPDIPTINEQIEGLELVLWSGLFVRKGTPQEARDVIARIAQETVMGDEAQQLGKNSGALVYWQPAEEALPRIDRDYDLSVQLYKELEGE